MLFLRFFSASATRAARGEPSRRRACRPGRRGARRGPRPARPGRRRCRPSAGWRAAARASRACAPPSRSPPRVPFPREPVRSRFVPRFQFQQLRSASSSNASLSAPPVVDPTRRSREARENVLAVAHRSAPVKRRRLTSLATAAVLRRCQERKLATLRRELRRVPLGDGDGLSRREVPLRRCGTR